MKPYINLLIFVLAAVAIYTAYELVTFKVDEPRQFVFSEPKLPPEMIKEDEEFSSMGNSKTSDIAVNEAQKAFSIYREAQKVAPQQVNDTLALLLGRMTGSDLPLYFLSAATPQNGMYRVFETLKIDTQNKIEASETKKTLNCTSKIPVASIIIGTSGKDVISCDAKRDITGSISEPDFIFIGGPENDQISDSLGNRIVNGGTGDDTIKLGMGRSIIVLDASWGKDILDIDCAGSNINPSEVDSGFAIPWVYKATNFIVLGNSINPKDVVWEGNVLSNKSTGDTLTVNQNCFTVVPSSQ